MVLWHINHCWLLLPNLFLYIQTGLFQTIQFTMSTQFSLIWPIDRTLTGATSPGQIRSGSDGRKGVLYIFPKLQYCWSLTISLFSIISKTLDQGGGLFLCRDAVGVFCSPSQLGQDYWEHLYTCKILRWNIGKLVVISPSRWGLEHAGCIICSKVSPPPYPRSELGIDSR